MYSSQRRGKQEINIYADLKTKVSTWLNEAANHPIREPEDNLDKLTKPEAREGWRLCLKHLRRAHEVRFITRCTLLDALRTKEKADGCKYRLSRRVKSVDELSKVLEMENWSKMSETLKCQIKSMENQSDQAKFKLRSEAIRVKSASEKIGYSDLAIGLQIKKYEHFNKLVGRAKDLNDVQEKMISVKRKSDESEDDQFDAHTEGCADSINKLITILNDCDEKDDVIFGLINGVCEKYGAMTIRETLFSMMNSSLCHMMKRIASIDIAKDMTNHKIPHERDTILNEILLVTVGRFLDLKMYKKKIKDMVKENDERKMQLSNMTLKTMNDYYEAGNSTNMEKDIKIWIDSEIELSKAKTKKNRIWKNIKKIGQDFDGNALTKETKDQLILKIDRTREAQSELLDEMSNDLVSIRGTDTDLMKIYERVKEMVEQFIISNNRSLKQHDEQKDSVSLISSPWTVQDRESECTLPFILKCLKNIHWIIIQKILFPGFAIESDKHKEIVEKWMRDSRVQRSENSIEIIENRFGQMKESLKDIEKKLERIDGKLNMWIEQPFLEIIPPLIVCGLYNYAEWSKKFDGVLDKAERKKGESRSCLEK